MRAIDLISDNLKDHELWAELAEIAQDVYDTKLGAPLRELDNIRNINADTDPVLVEKAIRQAGLTISNEFFKLNRDNLRLNYHELIKFWEHTGTPRYTRVIEFILGRDFSEQVLYSQDDTDLSVSPGKLLVDGGTWYPTSHVNLQVDAKGLRESLVLRIQPEDIDPIRDILGFSHADDQGKAEINALIDDLQTRELDLENDDPRIISLLIRNRIMTIYYNYAPIEMVVNEIYLSVSSPVSFLVAGSSLSRPKKYVNASHEKIVGHVLNLPSKIVGMKDYRSSVRVIWSTTTNTEEFPLSLDDDTLQSEIYPDNIRQTNGNNIELFEHNLIVFKDVDEITPVELEITTRGTVWLQQFDLYPSGIPFDPDEIYIRGPNTAQEGRETEFTLITRFDTVRDVADPDRVTWRIDTNSASFQGNVLTVHEIFESESAAIEASYLQVDGTTATVYWPVVLEPQPKPVQAKELRLVVEARDTNGNWTELNPESDIEQDFDNIYITPTIVLSDSTEVLLHSRHTLELGDSAAPVAQFTSSSGSVFVEPDGRLYMPVSNRDFSVQITARYVHEYRDLRGSVTLRLKRPRIFIVEDGLQIVGPDSVTENTRAQYKLQARWSTGAITYVIPKWISRDDASGFAGTIDKDGYFYAPEVGQSTQTLNVGAELLVTRFDAQDREYVARVQPSIKKVTVVPLERRVEALDFQILESLSQGNANGFRVFANWNDSTETEVLPYRVELRHNDTIISTYVRKVDGTGDFTSVDRNPIILISDTRSKVNTDQPNDIGVGQKNRLRIEYLASSDTLDNINGLVDIYAYYVDPVEIPYTMNENTRVYSPPVLTDEYLIAKANTIGLALASPESVTDLNKRAIELLNSSSDIKAGFQTISVIPKIFLSESIEIVAPETMRESSRVFLTAVVTYRNGDSEQVNANWTLSSLYPTQEVEADMAQGAFTLANMVNSLLGIDRDWFEANSLSEQQVQKLISGDLVFLAMSEQPQADWTLSVRDLMDAHSVSTQLYEANIPISASAVEGAQTPRVDLEWLQEGNVLNDSQVLMLVNLVDKFKVLHQQNSNRTVSQWTSLLQSALEEFPSEPLYQRALIQTRPLEDEESQQFAVRAQYFRQEEEVFITNVADPAVPINSILSSRVEGPGEIVADRSIFYSYQFVVDFDDGGIPYAVSNAWRVDVANKLEVLTLLLGGDPLVSSTWDPTYTGYIPTTNTLSLTPLAELTEEQLNKIFETLVVADIDTNGYLYPRISVDADLIVYADYTDGIQTFTQSMPVVMRPTNSLLTGMKVLNMTYDGLYARITNRRPGDESDINGVIKISDVPLSDPAPNTPNSFQTVENGLLYYTFKAQVERTDDLGDENGSFSPSVVEWNLNTTSANIHLGTIERDTITLIVEPVSDDQEVVLHAVYSEEFARSEDHSTPGDLAGEDRVETIAASLRFLVEASQAIDSIAIVGTTTLFDNSDEPYVPEIAITRRDGSLVDDPNAIVTWNVLGGPLGFAYDSDLQGFIVPSLQSNTLATIRATAREGVKTIKQDFQLNLQQAFQPQGIELVLPQENQTHVIDTALINLSSRLINFDATRVDATDRTFFFFATTENDARIVNDYQLEIDSIAENKTIELSLRSKDFPSTETQVVLNVYSSFPYSAVYPVGFAADTNLPEAPLTTESFLKLFSRSGGTFELVPGAEDYGYFMHPKIFGRATITYIPDLTRAVSLFGDWTGLGTEPLEVTRTYETGLTETWYLYRTKNRGFDQAKFAVTYTPE